MDDWLFVAIANLRDQQCRQRNATPLCATANHYFCRHRLLMHINEQFGRPRPGAGTAWLTLVVGTSPTMGGYINILIGIRIFSGHQLVGLKLDVLASFSWAAEWFVEEMFGWLFVLMKGCVSVVALRIVTERCPWVCSKIN